MSTVNSSLMGPNLNSELETFSPPDSSAIGDAAAGCRGNVPVTFKVPFSPGRYAAELGL